MKQLNELTDADRAKLRACIHANPEGCRSADGECGPFDRYGTRPCFEEVGISWDDMRLFHNDEQDRLAATGTERLK